jgi:hypothetical protein
MVGGGIDGWKEGRKEDGRSWRRFLLIGVSNFFIYTQTNYVRAEREGR